jgi:hypothetical protein
MAIATGTAILAAGGLSAGASILGAQAAGKAGSAQADAATQGAALQAQATRDQIAAQERMFERQVELQEPWRQAGMTALNQLTPLATNYTKFGMEQFGADPGYQFRLDQGLRAMNQTAAARGGLISGNALKAGQQYGQEYASGEYQNAFNRYQTERNAQLNPLQSLAGVGQSSANQLAASAGQMGSNMANIYGQAGQQQAAGLANAAQARASGYVGQTNALSSGISNISNMYMQNMMLDRMFGDSGGGMTYGGG